MLLPSPLKPHQALNKAFLKLKALRIEIDRFKAGMTRLIAHSDENESEEFHKNLVAEMLKDVYYGKKHFINTKGRQDLAIHAGDNAGTPVAVIVEAKKPSNAAETVSKDDMNRKAMQELLLYYMRERVAGKNLQIKQLIITNVWEWFVFDAAEFERVFVSDKKFLGQFEDFKAGRLPSTKTEFW